MFCNDNFHENIKCDYLQEETPDIKVVRLIKTKLSSPEVVYKIAEKLQLED